MIKVLDHGYLKLIESWGSDERIIESARMSTDKGFLGWGPRCKHCNVEQRVCGDDAWGCHSRGGTRENPIPHEFLSGDEKLLKYLSDNKHETPFEFSGMVIEVQAPIFVFREWHRHRTQSYNEMSARYTPLPDLNYVPTVERLLINSKTNKQAGTIKDAEELTEERCEYFRKALVSIYTQAEGLYQEALLGGVPKELARVHLPVGRYSRMRASANLRNWLAFLVLREAPTAQWEIRQYAHALHTFLKDKFPRTVELLELRQKI